MTSIQIVEHLAREFSCDPQAVRNTLEMIDAGLGNVSLLAEGSVLDANGAAVNVHASALRIEASASPETIEAR